MMTTPHPLRTWHDLVDDDRLDVVDDVDWKENVVVAVVLDRLAQYFVP